MSKVVKSLIAKELTGRYASATDAVWVEMLGIDGLMTNEFRRSLRSKNMRLEVVKTSLFRRALKDRPIAKLADLMKGPSALVTGEVSAVEVAKHLEEWAPKFPKDSFRLRAALLEGELIAESQVADLSKMPTRRDLQARVAGMLMSPGGRVAASILSGGSGIAGCIKALIDKLEKEPTAAA